jgi:hypothetical protein
LYRNDRYPLPPTLRALTLRRGHGWEVHRVGYTSTGYRFPVK